MICHGQGNVVLPDTDGTGANGTKKEEKKRIRRSEQEWTRAEIAKHNTRESCWVIIDDRVYDMTSYLDRHPGGDVILTKAGDVVTDASDIFLAYHPDYVRNKLMHVFCVGKVIDPRPRRPLETEYKKLYKTILEEGIFETNYFYYAGKMLYPLVLGAIAFYLFFFCPQWDSVYKYILGTVLLSLMQHQGAFIGHDTLHGAITHNWAIDYSIGLFFGNVIFGVSSLWWKYTHNQHHVVTNEYDRDPDITHLPVFAVDKYMFLSKTRGKDLPWWQLMLVRFQVVTYLPIIFVFGRINLYIQGFLLLFIKFSVPTMPWQKLHFPSRWVNAERLGIILYFAWYSLMAYMLPAQYRIMVVVLNHLLIGFLHLQLGLSHYERPHKHSSDEEDTFFEKQAVTSRNIMCTPMTGWFYGGLQFQLEHHLFPRVPRHNFRKLQKHVRKICEKHNVEYCYTGFWHTVFDVIDNFWKVSNHAFTEKVE